MKIPQFQAHTAQMATHLQTVLPSQVQRDAFNLQYAKSIDGILKLVTIVSSAAQRTD